MKTAAPVIPVPQRPAAPIDFQWESDQANPLRRFAFYFSLAAVFIRFSVIHEVLSSVLNLNLYLLYIVLPPAILGAFLTGGFRRMMQARSARFWLAFLVWIFMAVPFSIWRGASTQTVLLYTKAEIVMLLVIAGVVMTWKECKLLMITLALAAATDVAVGRIFMREGSDRNDLDLGGSTIANSNDMAVHLILMMAFLVYVVMAPKIPTIFRLASLPAIAYGVFLILGSGSRGALIALIVSVLFSFLMGSSKYRMTLILLLPIAAVVLISTLPRATLMRLSSITSGPADQEVYKDAEGSSEVRRELLKKSLLYTLERPVFGVGPGQFYNAEGGESVKEGRRGLWHSTHNSWTQISSECGIPGLIFFAGAIVSAFRLMLKLNRLTRGNPVNADIKAVAYCMMLGMVGFLAAITFANFAYFFYEPALCGLCIVIYSAAQHEMATRQSAAALAPRAAPLWAPAQPLALSPPSFASKLR